MMLFPERNFCSEEEVKTDLNYTLAGICKEEYRGFSVIWVTRHPLHFFKEWIDQKGIVPCERYAAATKDGRVKMIGWYMTSQKNKN